MAKRPDPQINIQTSLNSLKTKLKAQADKLSQGNYVPQSDDDLFLFDEPVSPKTFIESKEYYNNNEKHIVYPWIIEDLEEIFSGKYHAPKYQTIVELAGTGSGKAYLGAFADAYLIYWLQSFKSLRNYFKTKNISWDDKATISFINMAPTKDQAKHIVFERIRQVIFDTKIFRERNWLPDPNITTSMQFKSLDKETNEYFTKLAIVPGCSNHAMALGFSVYGGILDESCFFKEKNTDPAIALYEEMDQRRRSRFQDEGMVMLISSANCDTDLTETLGERASHDSSIFFRRRSRYDCKPEFFGQPKFTLEVKKEKLDGTIQTIILHPPESLKPLYQLNKDKSLRDIDAIPSMAGSPFYADFALLLSKVNLDRNDPCPDLGLKKPESPIDVLTRLPKDFIGVPEANYRIHVDLGTGDTQKGKCAAGFAMAHKVADINFGFKIKLDLSVRFKSEPDKEINFEDILSLIKILKVERGFNIDLVTFDQWQSTYPSQVINGWNNGIKADKLAVGYKEHVFLKNLMTTGQLDFYSDNNLFFELKRLEDYQTSVAPAIGSFKDEADAVAGVVYSTVGLVASKDDEKPKPRATHPVMVPRSGGFTVQNPTRASYKDDSPTIPNYRRPI